MESIVKHQSRFVVEAVCLAMWIASLIRLGQYEVSCSMTCAPSQFKRWSWSCTWTAMPFFLSPFLTAALCSTNLFSRFLPVSLMYFLSQSMQGTSYTTSFFFNAGLPVFTRVRVWRRVPLDLKTALSLSFLQIRSMCSEVSLT